MGNSIPASVTDVLLHQKDTDRTERVMMPITRYDNVLSAPTVVQNGEDTMGAPFLLLETDEEVLSVAQIRTLCGGVV